MIVSTANAPLSIEKLFAGKRSLQKHSSKGNRVANMSCPYHNCPFAFLPDQLAKLVEEHNELAASNEELLAVAKEKDVDIKELKELVAKLNATIEEKDALIESLKQELLQSGEAKDKLELQIQKVELENVKLRQLAEAIQNRMELLIKESYQVRVNDAALGELKDLTDTQKWWELKGNVQGNHGDGDPHFIAWKDIMASSTMVGTEVSDLAEDFLLRFPRFIKNAYLLIDAVKKITVPEDFQKFCKAVEGSDGIGTRTRKVFGDRCIRFVKSENKKMVAHAAKDVVRELHFTRWFVLQSLKELKNRIEPAKWEKLAVILKGDGPFENEEEEQIWAEWNKHALSFRGSTDVVNEFLLRYPLYIKGAALVTEKMRMKTWNADYTRFMTELQKDQSQVRHKFWEVCINREVTCPYAKADQLIEHFEYRIRTWVGRIRYFLYRK